MLSHYFSKLLKDQGYYSIHIGSEKLDLQTLAVKMLVKGYGIMDEKREGNTVLEVEGIRLLKGRGSEKSDCIFMKGGKNIITDPPEFPKIVIDLGLFNSLTEEENISPTKYDSEHLKEVLVGR